MPQLNESNLREEICRLGESLFSRGLTFGSAGNISVRLEDGWLMTPTNFSLGRLDPARLAKLDGNGNLGLRRAADQGEFPASRHVQGTSPSWRGRAPALHILGRRVRPCRHRRYKCPAPDHRLLRHARRPLAAGLLLPAGRSRSGRRRGAARRKAPCGSACKSRPGGCRQHASMRRPTPSKNWKKRRSSFCFCAGPRSGC